MHYSKKLMKNENKKPLSPQYAAYLILCEMEVPAETREQAQQALKHKLQNFMANNKDISISTVKQKSKDVVIYEYKTIL